MKKLIYLLTVSISLGTMSCGKDGAGGPQDPTGTANVIYSDWMSFRQAQRDTVVDGTNLKINHIPAPQLTQAHIDNGTLMVYMQHQTNVYPLPYTSDAGSGNMASTISFIAKPSVIYVTRYTHDNSASLGFSPALQFRYIIIPGGVTAKSAQLENINLQDYGAIRTALNIED